MEPRARRRRPAASWGDIGWTGADAHEPRDEFAAAALRAERLAAQRSDAEVRPRPAPERKPERAPEQRAQPARDEGPAGRRTVRISGQPTPPRRRPASSGQISARPDRIALWAVLLGFGLVFMAVATANAGGWSHATLGERTLGKGDRGSDVQTLQRVLDLKGYALSADGIFGPRTKRAVKRFQGRRGLARDGRVGPLTTRALASTWGLRTATYYGPGLYGNRTACGHTLAHRTRGVAHRSLPCGTRIPIYHAGRIALVPVIDRGPHTNGVSLDLTEAAARKVGMRTTSRVRAGY